MQTGCLAVALLLLMPVFFVGIVVVFRSYAYTRAEDINMQLRMLQFAQTRYHYMYGQFCPTLELGNLSRSDPRIAAAEGIPGDPGVKPYEGYVFRVLTAQGPHAPGGRKRYVTTDEDGTQRMTEGYAIIAIPVTHYNHGLTLVVSHHGPIHGKALEGDAARVGGEMTEYDPDGSWIESRR